MWNIKILELMWNLIILVYYNKWGNDVNLKQYYFAALFEDNRIEKYCEINFIILDSVAQKYG